MTQDEKNAFCNWLKDSYSKAQTKANEIRDNVVEKKWHTQRYEEAIEEANKHQQFADACRLVRSVLLVPADLL